MWRRFDQGERCLRRPRVDSFFYMWHKTQFFAVSSSARSALYPGLPAGWMEIKALEYLCVPPPSVMAYVSARKKCLTRVELVASQHRRQLVHAVLLSEWAFLALLLFVRAAHDELPFFTKFPDPRLTARRHEPPGYRGVLFHL